MAIKISGSTIIDDSRNIVSAGVVTATSYHGDGSNLTNLPASGLEVDACINVITQNTCSGCNLDGTSAAHRARDNVFIGCCAAYSATCAHNSIMIGACAVSYTHLTLPTKRIV